MCFQEKSGSIFSTQCPQVLEEGRKMLKTPLPSLDEEKYAELEEDGCWSTVMSDGKAGRSARADKTGSPLGNPK